MPESEVIPPPAPFVKDGPGSLVLSEFAGSAQSLSGAIRVNPWNTEELATAIHTSLTLSPVERELRHSKLYRYVSSHTAAYWATTFMSEFRDIKQLAPQHAAAGPTKLNHQRVLSAYERATEAHIRPLRCDIRSPRTAQDAGVAVGACVRGCVECVSAFSIHTSG